MDSETLPAAAVLQVPFSTVLLSYLFGRTAQVCPSCHSYACEEAPLRAGCVGAAHRFPQTHRSAFPKPSGKQGSVRDAHCTRRQQAGGGGGEQWRVWTLSSRMAGRSTR